MDNSKAASEVVKLQQHLNLLKEEYVKLQSYNAELERKYAVSSASVENGNKNSFVARLLKTVSGLYDTSLYSDLKIKLQDKTVPAHKFVLAARSDDWNVASLPDTECLDWSDLPSPVGEAILKWTYTDLVNFSEGDDFTLQLMRTANKFFLHDLVSKCEKALMASVHVRNCVRFYTTADEIGAESLKEHCSSLISAHWDDFTSEDFAHMSAPLLFHMFKNKTDYPLHSAVRLHREDVVFLYLVENSAQLSTKLNQFDNHGDLPLDIAIKDRQTSIAATLLEHKADPDAKDSKGWTLLHRAVERGDSYAATFLLENGASVAIATPDLGNTALHLIASCSPDITPEETLTALTGVAKLMLDKGLDPNIQNKKGFAALHLAVMTRNEEIFALLLKRSETQMVNLDVQTVEGHSPMWYALFASRKLINSNSFAARLFEKGANANPIYPQTNDSLLHLVAEEGLEEAALFICSHANNLNHINRKGESALHIACAQGLHRLATNLLEADADPNLQTLPPEDLGISEEANSIVYKQTPLHVAITNRQDSCVKAILQFKATQDQNATVVADLNLKNSRDDSPLSLALNCQMQHVVPDLIKGGADINVRTGEERLTLLHQAIINEDAKIATFLLEQGANMDAKTMDNVTPLQLAIKHKVGAVVEALCKRGADMSVKDENNNCPLWVALDSGEEDIASTLVRYGVDTDCWDEGPEGCWQTLLHRAIDENKEGIAKFLIQSGCDLNTPRKPGPGGTGGEEARDLQTPLHLCCVWGLESVVQTLVEFGADVNAKDSDGKTPLHVAIVNQHSAIISLLLCHPGLDLTQRDKSGLTPFATALTCRNNKAATAILEKLPTAAEQFDNRGCNFLHMAIMKHDVESVLFLLSIQVDVNSRVQDSNQTPPLHLTAATGDETLVRSLLLVGARVDDRDARRKTALHVAAESGYPAVVSALLGNNCDCDAVDSEGDNALHIACQFGHPQVVRMLLSESRINAETINLKGRNPLHVLARYGKENAAAICELFMEFIPDYPWNKPDVDGNTALLLAYMKGNGQLCRALVKAGACVGSMNKESVTIFNYQVATKTLLYKLLDHLSREPPWTEGDICYECGTKFNITMRKHHCRHCGRLLCSKCSSHEIPILKFNLNKPVRVCGVCFNVLQGAESDGYY
ncbi:unnamed protein product [Bemisia tabaci]|uniref:Ankyrin repeat and FYVE domain-containing protein 1 n=1 Tax=Bemisia tabaci TaxID=7038 RepID=A0A9P0F8K9_BEMTA|nr:unnamed protein product [Bemisia tabaci]